MIETPRAACQRLGLPVVGDVAPDLIECGAFEPGSVVVARGLSEKLVRSLPDFRVTPSGPRHVVIRPAETRACCDCGDAFIPYAEHARRCPSCQVESDFA